jgi:hypothetical protein
MLRIGLEPTTPVFERAKTVYALYRAATVIGKGKGIPVAGHQAHRVVRRRGFHIF